MSKYCLWMFTDGKDVKCAKLDTVLGDIMGYDGKRCKNCKFRKEKKENESNNRKIF